MPTISEHKTDAAERVRLRIVETLRLLSALPGFGRSAASRDTRVPGRAPYFLVYRVDMADEDEP